MSLQAFIALVYGLVAVYLEWGGISGSYADIVNWVICYSAARHFFSSFDEPKQAFLSNLWAFLWSKPFLGAVIMYALLPSFFSGYIVISCIRFWFRDLILLDKADKLSVLLRRQIVFVMIAVVVVVLAFLTGVTRLYNFYTNIFGRGHE